jgi:hypothetical protein
MENRALFQNARIKAFPGAEVPEETSAKLDQSYFGNPEGITQS